MVKKDHAHVNIVLPEALWKQIRMAAIEQDVSASELIARVMADHLEKPKKKPKK